MFDRLQATLDNGRPGALSVLRFVAGLCYFEAGTVLILHFPTTAMDGPLPPILLAAGYLELIGGFLVLIGLWTRPAAFILSGQMAIGYLIGHILPTGSLDPVVNKGGPAILYCFIFLYLVFAGGGPWSVDALLGRRWRQSSASGQPIATP
jgi:putative oxidoreductase